MKIQVLGSGCPTCKKLYDLTLVAVDELKLEAEVEYIDDISKIIELGIIQSPVMLIDEKVVMLGSSNLEKIKETILSNKEIISDNKKNKCCCGNKC